MMYKLETNLKAILGSPSLHGRFLNTLSYLEYIGFRKIVKSQQAESLTLAILAHANEEGRHALLLKKLALRVGGEALSTYRAETLLCGREAEEYLQSLDAEAQLLAEPLLLPPAEQARFVYAYVTWLVEERALQVYGAYMKVAESMGLPTHFSGLLKEEDAHLREVKAQIFSNDLEGEKNRAALQRLEAGLYQKFLDSLSLALTELKAPRASC